MPHGAISHGFFQVFTGEGGEVRCLQSHRARILNLGSGGRGQMIIGFI